MNLTSGNQNSIKTKALRGFSMYFKPTNRDKIGRWKNNLNKGWLNIAYLLCAGHWAKHWKYMVSSNSHNISNRKLLWSLPWITHMPTVSHPISERASVQTALSATTAGTPQRHHANPLPVKGQLKLTSTLYQCVQEKKENISFILMNLEMQSFNCTSPKQPWDFEKLYLFIFFYSSQQPNYLKQDLSVLPTASLRNLCSKPT